MNDTAETDTNTEYSPSDVLDFWFPDTGLQNDPEAHSVFMTERMQGGMDAAIIERFGGLTMAAATGRLDHWAESARGRLALLIALDQFPRSLWRDTPAAYAQDIKAARLALEGLENGHFDALAPREMTFYMIAIVHCEGPDHIDRMRRMDAVVDAIEAKLPESLAAVGPRIRAQNARVSAVIERFGRHPHRNAVLSRPSTPEEESYVAKGDFPHLPPPGS